MGVRWSSWVLLCVLLGFVLGSGGGAWAQEDVGDGLPDCAIGDRLVECGSPDPCADQPFVPGCMEEPVRDPCQGEEAFSDPSCPQSSELAAAAIAGGTDCASGRDVQMARQRLAPIRKLAPVLRDELVLQAFLNGAPINPGGKTIGDDDTNVNRLISGVRTRVEELGGEIGCTVADAGVGSCLGFIDERIARDQADLLSLSGELLLPIAEDTLPLCDADPQSGELRAIVAMLDRFQEALRAAGELAARFASTPPDGDLRVRCDDVERARDCEFLERRAAADAAEPQAR
jgi:hypothetical protein